jgi:hypothetical protein
VILKFFKRGQKGKGAIEYLTDAKLHKNYEVMRGDPEVVRKLILSNKQYKHRYTSGVMSFSEKEIDRKTLDEIINDLEKLFFRRHEQRGIRLVRYKTSGEGARRIALHSGKLQP